MEKRYNNHQQTNIKYKIIIQQQIIPRNQIALITNYLDLNAKVYGFGYVQKINHHHHHYHHHSAVDFKYFISFTR